jgi:CxxC motif-containing protein
MKLTNIICIKCPKGCRIAIQSEKGKIISISGNDCPRGVKYAQQEFSNPVRILSTTVKVINGDLPLVPVKTEKAISKELLLKAMEEIADIKVEAPIKIGQVIKNNLLGTGVRLIAIRNIKRI